MHRRRLQPVSWLSPVLLAVTAAAGQTAVPDEPVEPLFEDVSPLARSLRDQPVGLQQPNDFGRVYRDGDELMRMQGALQAVFPRSEYAVDREGRLVTAVPSGTTFYIGAPFALPTPALVPSLLPARVTSRLELRVGPDAPVEPAGPLPRAGVEPMRLAVPEPPPGPSGQIVVDERYRAERLRVLMRFAARAHERRLAVTPR